MLFRVNGVFEHVSPPDVVQSNQWCEVTVAYSHDRCQCLFYVNAELKDEFVLQPKPPVPIAAVKVSDMHLPK